MFCFHTVCDSRHEGPLAVVLKELEQEFACASMCGHGLMYTCICENVCVFVEGRNLKKKKKTQEDNAESEKRDSEL